MSRYKNVRFSKGLFRSADDFDSLVARMKEHGFFGEYLNDNAVLMDMLV